jgi:multiple sugar transport system permease protein
MKKLSSLPLYLAAAVVLLLILWPFAWQVITSLKPAGEIFSKPVLLLPREVYLKNYADVFSSGPPFHRYILNSIVIAGFATVVSMTVGALCGYALARLPLKGKNLVLMVFLAAAMFPQVAVLSPLFLILRSLGLLNTHIGLGLIYTAYGLPLAVWMFNGFFRDVPKELEEAALVDGCTPLSALYRVVLPVAGPGFFSAAILVFIFSWNEFLFSLVFNTSLTMRTVTVGISLFPGLYETPWGTIFAAATIITLPVILLVFFFQKRIVAGLTAGAVK